VVHVGRADEGLAEDVSGVLDVLAGVVPSLDVAACDPRDTLTDLGVDSLTLVAFVAALETRFGVRLPNEELEALGTATLHDVARLVARAADGSAMPAREEDPAATTIRAFREADRPALRRICMDEASFGPFRELSPLFFLEQYCDADPGSCFVAEANGEIVGYWVGTLDVARLQRDFPRHMLRHAGEIARWYRRAWRRLSIAEHRRFWHLVLVDRQPPRTRTALMARLGGDMFGRTYPHFQVDRKRAPAGTVFALARAWLDHLRSRGVRGALLPSVPGGEAALEMWKRAGFTPVPGTTPAGDPGIWLLAVL
jgi:acyl carrier protein